MEIKKVLIILILRILETESDSAHPITQLKIAELISAKYPCDRKTVGRNIKFLCELGYPIVKTAKGFYMDKMLFSREEIKFIVNSVRGAEGDLSDREELCDRLYTSLSRYYKS